MTLRKRKGAGHAVGTVPRMSRKMGVTFSLQPPQANPHKPGGRLAGLEVRS